jgi:hypothetical protein
MMVNGWFEIVTFGTTKIATWHINCLLGKINKNKNLF